MTSLELVRSFLENRLGVQPERVEPASSLIELGVDSMMMLELMFEFETHLGIRLPTDLETPRTVGEMLDMMDRLAQA
ncbi:MAG: acyl carrier protein [Hydrogenophaga sp.]|jgi:acyl carrier protein|nr:acyl carrier protein [Hydrogenophaga sp.]